MTKKTATVLKAQFQGTDPHDHNEDLLDSIFVLDSAVIHDGSLTLTGALSAQGNVSISGDVTFNGGTFVLGAYDPGGTMTTASAISDMSGFFNVMVSGTVFKVPFFQDA